MRRGKTKYILHRNGENMKVTVLIENTSPRNLIHEHGLSLLVEENGKRILLDAGSTEAFTHNAESMGISLYVLDACVLSHGHYDHSGGFAALFEANKEMSVYALLNAVHPYFSGSGGIHEIGIPANVLAHKDRFHFVDGLTEIFDGVYLVPHTTKGLEKIGRKSKLFTKEENTLVPDDFSHEQSLVFDTNKGLIIFNSCSHGGVENIVKEAKTACPHKPVYAYVGGLHMKGKAEGKDICTFSDEEIDVLCSFIQKEKIKHVYTGHCTGLPGTQKLQARLGDTVKAMTTGMCFEL